MRRAPIGSRRGRRSGGWSTGGDPRRDWRCGTRATGCPARRRSRHTRVMPRGSPVKQGTGAGCCPGYDADLCVPTARSVRVRRRRAPRHPERPDRHGRSHHPRFGRIRIDRPRERVMSEVPAPRRVGNAEIIHHEGYDDSIVSPFVPAIRTVSDARLVFISGVTGAPVYHDHPHVARGVRLDADGRRSVRCATRSTISISRSRRRDAERHDVVNLIRFFTDVAEDQDVVNAHQAAVVRRPHPDEHDGGGDAPRDRPPPAVRIPRRRRGDRRPGLTPACGGGHGSDVHAERRREGEDDREHTDRRLDRRGTHGLRAGQAAAGCRLRRRRVQPHAGEGGAAHRVRSDDRRHGRSSSPTRDIVFSMVSASKDLEAVMLGPAGCSRIRRIAPGDRGRLDGLGRGERGRARRGRSPRSRIPRHTCLGQPEGDRRRQAHRRGIRPPRGVRPCRADAGDVGSRSDLRRRGRGGPRREDRPQRVPRRRDPVAGRDHGAGREGRRHAGGIPRLPQRLGDGFGVHAVQDSGAA